MATNHVPATTRQSLYQREKNKNKNDRKKQSEDNNKKCFDLLARVKRIGD
jgi:hypothetical protein